MARLVLGQLAGLEAKKSVYQNAVLNLADKSKTTLILVSRPEETPLLEAERSSLELSALGINNQLLLINGVLNDASDALAKAIMAKQQSAMEKIPPGLRQFEILTLPLRSYNILGLDHIRMFFARDNFVIVRTQKDTPALKQLSALIDDIYASGKKVIFAMGKGGVGKTTLAATLAMSLARKGVKVHLTSTDPANHLDYVIEGSKNITLSKIDEACELLNYQNEVLTKARETMCEEDIAYIEEDLRSPCTQEIAVFRAFAKIVDRCGKRSSDH